MAVKGFIPKISLAILLMCVGAYGLREFLKSGCLDLGGGFAGEVCGVSSLAFLPPLFALAAVLTYSAWRSRKIA